MVKTLILYQSKYGFTEMIAKSLSLVLGPAKYCKTSELKGNYNDFEVVVICTPVYSEVVDNNILEYVTKNADWLKQKKVVLICICLAENRADHYLKPLKNILGVCADNNFLTTVRTERMVRKIATHLEYRRNSNSTIE